MPNFSIIIPVKPGGAVAALKYLRLLETGQHDFEILIAEGCRPSAQRNQAVLEASGEILYFLDDDSRVAPGCLDLIARTLEGGAAGVVGGPSLTPDDDSPLQQLFGLALSSLFGAGGVRNRYRAVGSVRPTTQRELILCNMAMRRDLFLKLKGFDERLYPNEENELLDRAAAEGMRILHDPELAIRRSQRATLAQFVRQMFSYGRGRMQQTIISGTISPVSLAPLLLLLYLFSLPAGLVLSPFWVLPLVLYGALTLGSAACAAISFRKRIALGLILIFPILHISNGWGLLRGLFGGRRGPGENRPAEVVVRRVKTFGQDVW